MNSGGWQDAGHRFLACTQSDSYLETRRSRVEKVKESFDLVKGGDVLIAVPIANISAAATNGIYASMKHIKRLNILVLLGAGTDTQNITFTLGQATTAAGGSLKALNITSVYYKAGADLSAVNSWTEHTVVDREDSVASLVETVSGVASLQKAFLFVVDEEDLDTNNGFTFVRVEMTDPGAGARNGSIVYIATEMSYQGISKPTLVS
jgi:hypothetical protein